MKVPFCKPDINEEDIARVCEVLRSGWITTGPVTKQFEKELAVFCHSNKVACVNSQTMGAEMVLRLLGIGPGDEVIVPAYTYTASCSVIEHVGARAVLIDSQPDNPEMDYAQMEAAINTRTKCVIPVDLGGVVCDYERIYEVLERRRSLFNATNDVQAQIGRVVVAADTAHSLGATRKSKTVGEIADFSSFSFHAVKNLTTAEGGAVTWNPALALDDEWVYKQLMLLSLHGQTATALSKIQSGQWEYDVVEPYYKGNLTDVAAALGLSQLRRYPQMLLRRQAIITRYDEAFRAFSLPVLRHYTEDAFSSGHLYLLRLAGFDVQLRNRLIELLAEAGISCNVHYKPLPMLTAYKKRGYAISDFPRAYALYENEVTLPLHSLMREEEVDYVVQCVCEAYRKLRPCF